MTGLSNLWFTTNVLLWLSLTGAVGFLGKATAQEVSGRFSIAGENGKFTLVADSRPLRQVLYELGLAAKVSVMVADAVGEDDISADLRKVTAEEAFHQLLTQHDAFFQFSVGKDGPAVLRAIWVYPKGASSDLRPVPPETWASAKELEAGLADADLAVRERAYHALMMRPDSRGRNLVLQAIRGVTEHDEALRQRIFSAAVSRGMELPFTLLSELVYADPSEPLRTMALEELSQHSGVKPVAEHALKDSSEVVRERAREILAEMQAAEHRAERNSQRE